MAKRAVEDLKVLPYFRTQYQARPRVPKVPGSGVHTLYSSRIAEDGTVELIPSGTEDIYASIQSHKDSVDIHMILARYNNGDETAFARVQGVYGDFTAMPTTFAQLLNTVIQGQDYFNSLPVEVRAKFDHSFEKFMASMDNMPEFMRKVGVTDEVSEGSSGVPKEGGPQSSDEPPVQKAD